MFHHVSIGVRDLDRSAAFYDAVMAALGHVRYMAKHGTVAWWPEGGGRTFWINHRPDLAEAGDDGMHIAFRASGPAMVDRFHAAALAAGAADDGAPGYRPEYHENYYGAFVRDPDGHLIEAVHLVRD